MKSSNRMFTGIALGMSVLACAVLPVEGQLVDSSHIDMSGAGKAAGVEPLGRYSGVRMSTEATMDYLVHEAEREDKERAEREKRMNVMGNYSNFTLGGPTYFDQLYYQPNPKGSR
ncbi:hypothetical protein W02_36190 [Nitrospira sp. KM1]|uniref:hypothetical protein n=1 Tax=Nitrospira sp. KM1 TaxID=1936990 RepID=UPI0013A78319|nr:hypothetical protein [Nitrospira sp. KM1]BCA56479.1 hypothetical protein W02_36190 [Nitrospira sp. KM1]